MAHDNALVVPPLASLLMSPSSAGVDVARGGKGTDDYDNGASSSPSPSPSPSRRQQMQSSQIRRADPANDADDADIVSSSPHESSSVAEAMMTSSPLSSTKRPPSSAVRTPRREDDSEMPKHGQTNPFTIFGAAGEGDGEREGEEDAVVALDFGGRTDAVLGDDVGGKGAEGEGEGEGGGEKDDENDATAGVCVRKLDETSMNSSPAGPVYDYSGGATISTIGMMSDPEDCTPAMMELAGGGTNLTPTSPRHVNGSNGVSATEVSKGGNKTKQSALKSTAAPQQCKIQFLATQRFDYADIDFDERITLDGNIIHHIGMVPVAASGIASTESVPSNGGTAGFEEDAPGSDYGIASAAIPHPASSCAMNGDFPTMASPMFPDRPRGSDFLDFKMTDENKKTKEEKKKSKKSGREQIIKKDSMDRSVLDDEKREQGKPGIRIKIKLGVTDKTSEPKRKKSRIRRKSDDNGAQCEMTSSTTNLTKDISGVSNDIGAVLPVGISFPSQNDGMTRTLLNSAPQPRRYKIVTDDDPNRMYNPLLSLPQYPDGISPPIEDIPQGGELWNIANLYFFHPDTYPISYLARLLGFDVPDEEDGGSGQEEVIRKFDPMTVKRAKDHGEHDAMTVPDRGSFCDRIWKGGRDVRGTIRDVGVGGDSAPTAATNYDNGMHDDLKLSYSDLLYVNILSSYRGYNDDDFKDAGKGLVDDLSTDCLNFAQERGVLPDRVSFRFGNEKDEEALSLLAEKVR